MVTRIRTSMLGAALLCVAAVHAAEHKHHTPRGVHSLDVYADGARVHLLTGETREGSDKPLLLYAQSEDGGATWSPPARADEGMPPGFSLHRGMDAQIAAAGDHVIAVWMTAGTDKWGSGPMATALSANGGKSWHAGPNPADDGSTTGHGFSDIAADRTGRFHLTWLDSRDGKQGLRYASSFDHGATWAPNTTPKAATCECCSNALATGPDGSVAILFRDSGPRDMSVALSRDGGSRWTSVRAGDFGWQFNGCPHVGGGVAFARGSLHTAVWTGMSEHAGVFHLTSADLGATWSQPLRLGGATASHPDLAAGADQRIAAVWDERMQEHSEIWGALSAPGGLVWDEPVRLSKAGRNASHPRVVAVADGFRFVWTESRPDGTTALGTALLP